MTVYTSYYLRRPSCDTCKREGDKLPIGHIVGDKYALALKAYPAIGLTTWRKWKAYLSTMSDVECMIEIVGTGRTEVRCETFISEMERRERRGILESYADSHPSDYMRDPDGFTIMRS